MARVSKRTVDALICAGARPSFLWDDALSGFGVKALPSGAKRYIVKYRSNGGGRGAPQRWLNLGSHGALTPDQARAMAQQALAAVARGEDPQSAKLGIRTAPTLSDVWLRFEAEYLPMRKSATGSEYRSQWRDIIEPTFGKAKVERIKRGDVDRLHKSLRETPYRANRMLALFSRLMSLAEAWDLRPQGSNPCKRIARFAEVARTRFLTETELQRLGRAIDELVAEGHLFPTAAHAIELLLLTGARLNEVLTAKWEWLVLENGILALPDSKTGAKPIFLSGAAIEVIERQRSHAGNSEFIFPSPQGGGRLVNLRKSWVRVCARANIQNVRLHDLRHTAASIAVGKGASLAIVGKLLGHTQAQTTLRYAHVDTNPAIQAANTIGSVVADAFRHGALSEE